MSFRDCLIVERPGDWYVVVGAEANHLDADSSAEEIAARVKLMAKHAALKSPKCVIAPAATSCFFARLDRGGQLDFRDRSALTYELESHVPLDAEAMVADFVVSSTSPKRSKIAGRVESSDEDFPVGTAKSVAAIAIEFSRWKELAEALEASGITVPSIIPSAMLVARVLSHGLSASDRTELLIVDQAQCDAVMMESDTLVAWKHLALDAVTVRLHRKLDQGEPSNVILIGADESQQEVLREGYHDTNTTKEERSLESLWIQGAELSLAKQSQRWFDLRREQLGPSDPLRPILPQLRFVTVAATACLLAIVLGGWWRTRRIEATIDQLAMQQRAAFAEAFPSSPVPAALVRRVRSEHTKVMGSRGASAEVDLPQSATEVLREVLAALPESVRFRVTGLKIVNGQVDIDLQVRTAVDAGVLAAALESRGFEVEPPVTTRKDAQTFDSVLEATWMGRSTNSSDVNSSTSESTSDGGTNQRIRISRAETKR